MCWMTWRAMSDRPCHVADGGSAVRGARAGALARRLQLAPHAAAHVEAVHVRRCAGQTCW
jgi:hypothetical protein